MSWEPLPDRDWAPTIRSLHRWSQIAGKVRMALAAPMNHWWHVTSYVSTRGLTTSPIPCRGGLIELDFDLNEDQLRLPYDEVALTDDPDATLLAFLEATYATGARLARWDRSDERALATVRG